MPSINIDPDNLTIAEGESYTEWLTEMADTIREKLGTNEHFKPVAFPTKMREMPNNTGNVFTISNNVNSTRFELNGIPSYYLSHNTNVGTSSQYGVVSVTDSSIHNYLTGEALEVGDWAFRGNFFYTDISFKYCRKIGNNAFTYTGAASIVNRYLRTASFPECKNIGSYAFGCCISLTTFYAPKCKTIGQYAFCGWDTTANYAPILTDVTLGSPESIGSAAFASAYRMTGGFTLEKAKFIGSSAFLNCSELSIPIDSPACSYVGANVALGTNNISYAFLPKLNQANTCILFETFKEAYGLEFAYISYPTYLLGSNYSSYCASTFWSCSSLKNVVLRNVRQFGFNMFRNDYNIKSIFLWHDNSTYFTSIPDGFTMQSYSCKIVVPDYAYSRQLSNTTSNYQSFIMSMPEAEFKARVKELVDEYRGVDTPIWGEDDGSETTS